MGHILEAVVDAILEWATVYTPRRVRIGCTAFLLVIVVGLLTIGLWWPR